LNPQDIGGGNGLIIGRFYFMFPCFAAIESLKNSAVPRKTARQRKRGQSGKKDYWKSERINRFIMHKFNFQFSIIQFSNSAGEVLV